MEETIGALWDKVVKKIAHTGFPHARVNLEEIRPIAAIFFRALGGDPGMHLQAGTPTTHGARLAWLHKIAGIGERVELTWMDEAALYLPASIDYFEQAQLNRDLYLWLIALSLHFAQTDTSDLPINTGEQAHWLERNRRACCTVLERFPALQNRYDRLVQQHLKTRPSPSAARAEAHNESLIRQALLQPSSSSTSQLLASTHTPAPVILWMHPQPPIGTAKPKKASQHQPEQAESSEHSRVQNDSEQRKRKAEQTDMPDNPNPFMLLFRAESLFSWAEYVKVNRALDEDDNPDAQRAADDLDFLSVAHDGKTSSSRIRFDLDLPGEEHDDLVIANGIRYPEWHHKKNSYLPQHTQIQMLLARDAIAQGLPEHLRRSARQLRQQFQSLRPQRLRLLAQAQGSDIDIDACVRFRAERRQRSSTPGLYSEQRQQCRDLSCLLLADLSMSTDTWVNNEHRVIDVIRDSLYLLAEALDASGDRFALYGFSSVRRHHVRMHLLKGFDERYHGAYGDQIRARLAAIKPGYYTRMGAAIRHSAAILSKQKTSRRLLLILTDGKPNDLDQYEGRYGIEDTRMAIQEARQLGLIPFCVTIDERAHDYLPHLFGGQSFVVVKDASELPTVLPRLYAQLTQ